MFRRLASLALLVVAATAPAHASGGISCEADDRSAKFTIGSPISRTAGGAFFQFEGSSNSRSAASRRISAS